MRFPFATLQAAPAGEDEEDGVQESNLWGRLPQPESVVPLLKNKAGNLDENEYAKTDAVCLPELLYDPDWVHKTHR